MKKLTERVYGVLTMGSGLNGYLIDNGGTFTLVDLGVSAGFVTTVEKDLASIGKSLADVKRLLITHAHPDHIGGIEAFQKKSNATTYAHRLDALVIRGEQPSPMANPTELGFFWRMLLVQMKKQKMPIGRVDREVNDNESVPEIAPNTKIVHLPGHSPGQIGLYLADEETLIAGDVLMRLPWGLVMPLRPASPDWNAVKDSIHKSAMLKPKNLFLGHGTPLVGNASQALQTFVQKL
jgi:glyoxylase-like metal-dependent hydrolase (beta-lactamase superfamily II)